MHPPFPKRQGAAFTLGELLIVIVVLAVCGLALAFWLPSRAKAVARGGPGCSGNQRQVALAFLLWANDHGEKFPMQVSVADGGTKGLRTSQQPLATFVSLSNELSAPKILKCPNDPERLRASNFAALATTNLSYFLSLDVAITNSASILIGERNLWINGQPAKRLLQVTNPALVTWGTQTHVRQGNVALVDGSAHHLTDPLLQKTLQDSETTNRFIIP